MARHRGCDIKVTSETSRNGLKEVKVERSTGSTNANGVFSQNPSQCTSKHLGQDIMKSLGDDHEGSQRSASTFCKKGDSCRSQVLSNPELVIPFVTPYMYHPVKMKEYGNKVASGSVSLFTAALQSRKETKLVEHLRSKQPLRSLVLCPTNDQLFVTS